MAWFPCSGIGSGSGRDNVISGYYHEGDFYEDQSYTQIITGDVDCLYIDQTTTTLYMFDGTDYVEIENSHDRTSLTDKYLTSIQITDSKTYGTGASTWSNFMCAYRNRGSGGLEGTLQAVINKILPNGLCGGTIKYRLSCFTFGNSGDPIYLGINGDTIMTMGNPWASPTRFVYFNISDYFIFDDLSHENIYTYDTSQDGFNFKLKCPTNAGIENLTLHIYLVGADGDTRNNLNVTEEVLLDTPTSTNDWATPVSVQIDRNAHLMVSIEIALSDNPQIRNTVYNFTMEELKHNIRGSSYLMIPDESIHEGSTTYTHILGYVCLVDNTLYIHVPGSASLTVNRITAIRKTNIHAYSTTEQVVGTWIDGKPIYEKTISWNNTRVEATSYAHGISDLEKCINSEAFLHDPDNDRTYILPFYGNDGILLVREVNQTYVILGGTNYFNASANRTFYVTLRYTKSTT